MNIIVTGTRGIPSIQGGVETHCEELYPLMLSSGNIHIMLICRSAYISKEKRRINYKGIDLKTLYSPKSKSFEAIVHTFLTVLYAAYKRPDILHIHAIGPNLLTPLARLLGLKVVMTHHGPDYERKKWGKIAKIFLRTGEKLGVKFANKVIVISDDIGKGIASKYGRNDYKVIPNGVPLAIKSNSVSFLDKLGIVSGKYIFTLGRFVPEKGFDYLIDAFIQSGLTHEYKLVIAGDADHESDFSISLKTKAKSNGIVLTGFIKGEALQQLFSHARLFVLPSFFEGLPIALLEAMSYNLDILASDIPANTQVKLPEFSYFKVGSTDELTKKIVNKLNVQASSMRYDLSEYRWDEISKQTIEVYKSIL